MQTKALILGGGKGSRARRMAGEHTPKPLMKVLGIRPLDLVVSLLQRCPEISDVRIAIEYLSNTMVEYIQQVYARPELDKRVLMMVNEGSGYGGTLGALETYVEFQERKGEMSNEQNIMVLSADHIYGMDYSKFIKFHQDNEADISVAVRSIPSDQAFRFGVMQTSNNIVESFIEKPKEKIAAAKCQVSMGIYIFSLGTLKKIIAKKLGTDIGKDAIPYAVQSKSFKVCAYRYNDFWVDVGEELGVWEAAFASQREILKIQQLIHNHYVQLPADPWPAEVSKPTAGVCRIGNGSLIEGELINSVVASGCFVGPDVKLDNCVLLPDVILTGKTTVKNTLIGANAFGTDFEFGLDLEKDKATYRHFFFDNEEGREFVFVNKFGFIPANESINFKKSYETIHKEVFGF